MTNRALAAADILAEKGISAGVLHLPTVKPLDEAGAIAFAKDVDLAVTVEENVLAGGVGAAILECFSNGGLLKRINMMRYGIPDEFASQYGNQDSLLELYGLQPHQLAENVANSIQ